MATAVLYEDIWYGGNVRSFSNNNPITRYAIGYFDPTFRNYGVRHSRRFNDYLSSVKLSSTGVPRRNTFIAFEDGGFNGRAWAYAFTTARDVPRFDDWSFRGRNYRINDKASSAIIVKHPDTSKQYPLFPIKLSLGLGGQYARSQIQDKLRDAATWPVNSISLRNEPLRFEFTIDNGTPLVKWRWPLHMDAKAGFGLPDDNFEAVYTLQFSITAGLPVVYVISSAVENQNFIYRPGGFFFNTLATLVGKGIRQKLDEKRPDVQAAVQFFLTVQLALYRLKMRRTDSLIQYSYLMPGGCIQGYTADTPIEDEAAAAFIDTPNDGMQPHDYFVPTTNFDTTLIWAPYQNYV